MMKLGLLCFFGLAAVCMGNGGGYFRGGVESAGDVAGFEPENTQKVGIMDELLTVRLGEKSANVEVRYVMKNLTGEKVKVRFGFPVEESIDRSAYGLDPSGASGKAADGNELKYCEDYRIESGGKELDVEWTGERVPKEDRRFESIAGWKISTLKFKANEEKTLSITFKSSYPQDVSFVSDDGYDGALIFRYRLSTGAVWGGPIIKGRVELIPDGIDPAELRVIKPVNRFRKEGDKWIWDFEGLEPTLADDLEIEAVPEVRAWSRAVDGGFESEERVRFYERGGKWSMHHRNYEARASSTLPADGDLNYEVANLTRWETAWSEGVPGNGIGEWIEVKPKVAKVLKALKISPGYDKSDELFKANARPKKVEVLLNDEHRFEVELRDAKEYQRIPVVGYLKPVKSVKLTFLEVWPGATYEDLCVSSLILEVALDKKPEIQPSR